MNHPLHRLRILGAALALTLLTALLVAVSGQSASAATLLVSESFGGTSVPEAAWQPLDDACLTKATAAPPAGSSTLGVCSKRTNSPSTAAALGFLQLTDNRTNTKGGAILNKAIPANGGLDIQFDQYQYGGALAFAGADGIGFFLTDGSKSLTAAGAPGGSLGYAQSTTVDGVNGGYLGIGLDAYGNFSNTAANGGGIGAGCPATPAAPGQVANRVVARGPGQAKVGYCYIAGAAPANGVSIRQPTTLGLTDPTTAYGRTIRITVSAATLPVVTVYTGGSAGLAAAQLTQVMQFTMTTAAPSSYKLGFTASTGGASDAHLIRNVSVSSINTLGALNLVKQIDQTTAQPTSYTEGATIPYQFLVTNTSSLVSLTGLAIADSKATGITCPTTTLAPSASTTCTGTHTVTAAEALSSTLVNTATASALSGSTTITSNVGTATAAITAANPLLTLTKSGALTDSNGNAQADVGESIVYSFAAKNTGNVTLTNVVVTDPRVTGITPASATIAPGGTANFTAAAYTVTQADINAGTAISNTATVNGRTVAGTAAPSASSTVNTPIRYAPGLTLTKNGTLNGTSAAGQTIGYSFTLANTGNTPLTAVSIADPKVTLSYSWPGTAGTLAVGQSVTATATYTLLQSDVDAGQVVNTATATGTPPTGAAVTSTASKTVTLTRSPAMTFTKTANPAFISAVGTVVTYTFTATNTGNATLTAVAVTDPHTGLSSIAYTWPGTAGRLTPGQVVTATATYTTTAADVTAGTISNTATVSGTPPTGAAITRTASVTIAVVPDPVVDSATVPQGDTVVIDVLANDGNAATGATFSRAQLSTTPKAIGGAQTPVPASPIYGSVTCVDSGSTRGQCTYRSVEYFVGTDVFDYALSSSYGTWNVRVTVTVTAKNHAPVARADRLVAATGGAAVSVDPLGNDTDPDGTTPTLQSVAFPSGSHGTFACTSSCTYTPAADGWTGTIAVPYTIVDAGGLTASSTITIYVDPAPIVRQGFTDRRSNTAAVSLGNWAETTTATSPAGTCVANRPSTTVSWTAVSGATNYVLERRINATGTWVTVAQLGAVTSFVDDRLGEGRSYQWRVRPDLQRWPGTVSAASTASAQAAIASAKGC
ncbi:cell wall anchor protein [Microbacteriaceae bacterium VKM Ac-2854]|nr:cell wall anchor protein [Microbacteriaceae bacterium VKM Ac-2854]